MSISAGNDRVVDSSPGRRRPHAAVARSRAFNSTGQERDRLGSIDAIKGAAILLVVFGHLIEPFIRADGSSRSLYTLVYSFHMPLFVLLTGVFASKAISGDDAAKIVRRIVLPFLIFQIVYTAYGSIVPGAYHYSWLQPFWHLWFLLSLFYWRLLLPIVRSPIGLAAVVLSALAIGWFPQVNRDLSIARTVYFAPFFIIGSLWGLALLERASRHFLICGVAFSICLFAVTLWMANGLDGTALRGHMAYGLKSPMPEIPMLGRLFALAVGLVGAISFAGLVPNIAPLRYLGRNVMAIFLLHAFVAIPFRGYIAPLATEFPLRVGLAVALTVPLAFATAPFQRHLDRVFNDLGRAMDWLNRALMPRYARTR